MLRRLRKTHGISLIELTVVIVVIGILTAVAMKSMTSSVENVRRVKTQRELQTLAKGIVGDPALASDRHRTDYGYVGDVGAFPSNLSVLVTNPGYGTWKGPYIRREYTADTVGFKTDEWGKPYTYSGVTVSSSGNGTPISVRLATNASDYLLNKYHLQIADVNDSLPGVVKKDSVKVLVTFPNGLGSLTTKTYRPILNGAVDMDSLPVGQHTLNVIYEPQNDTLARSITILPRHAQLLPATFKFSKNYFSAFDAMLTKVVGSDSISSYSPGCNGFVFWVRNYSGTLRTITSIKLTYSSPTAYYRYVKWNGTTVVSSNTPRVSSGQVAAFSAAQTISHGQTARVQVETFMSTASGGGSAVNMQNSTITVLFSDGSNLTVATGACN